MPTAALRDKVGRSAGCPARPILFSKFADDGTPFGFERRIRAPDGQPGSECGNAGAYVERGIAKQNKGDLDGAMADQNQAIQLNPINAIAYTNRRLLLYKIIYNIDLSF